MTGTEISKAERLAAQLRTDADRLDQLVKELKQEAVRIADALLEARQHGATISLGLTTRTDGGNDPETGHSKYTNYPRQADG